MPLMEKFTVAHRPPRDKRHDDSPCEAMEGPPGFDQKAEAGVKGRFRPLSLLG